MTKYIYHLSEKSKRNKTYDLESFIKHGSGYSGKAAGDNLDNCLCKFFSNEEIKQLVKEGNWMSIFEKWTKDYSSRKYGGVFYGNAPGWVLEFLLDFLYFCNVDFWSSLSDDDVRWINKETMLSIPWTVEVE